MCEFVCVFSAIVVLLGIFSHASVSIWPFWCMNACSPAFFSYLYVVTWYGSIQEVGMWMWSLMCAHQCVSQNYQQTLVHFEGRYVYVYDSICILAKSAPVRGVYMSLGMCLCGFVHSCCLHVCRWSCM